MINLPTNAEDLYKILGRTAANNLLESIENDGEYNLFIGEMRKIERRSFRRAYNDFPREISGNNFQKILNNFKTTSEKRICIHMFFKNPEANPTLGKIVDLQIPLKTAASSSRINSNKINNDGLGEIDLLAVKDKTAIIIEFKIAGSREPVLKAILEIYTYWKQLGLDDDENAKYFLDHSRANGCTEIKKAIVVYSAQAKELTKNKTIRQIAKDLGVKCYVVKEATKLTFKNAEELDLWK